MELMEWTNHEQNNEGAWMRLFKGCIWPPDENVCSEANNVVKSREHVVQR